MEAQLNAINTGLLRFLLSSTASEDPSANQHGGGINPNTAPPKRSPEEIAWLKEALAAMGAMESDAQRMKKLISVLRGQPEEGTTEVPTPDRLCVALEELIFFLEDLDNANDLSKLDSDGAAVETVIDLLSHADSGVRYWAAWVIATVAHNNPRGQADLLQHGVWGPLFKMLQSETEEFVRAKVVAALSAITSAGNEESVKYFASNGGFNLLSEFLTNAQTATTRARVIFWISRLVLDHPDVVLAATRESGIWAPALVALIERDVDLREKAARVLVLALERDPECRTFLQEHGAAAVIAEARRRTAANDDDSTAEFVQDLTSLEQMLL